MKNYIINKKRVMMMPQNHQQMQADPHKQQLPLYTQLIQNWLTDIYHFFMSKYAIWPFGQHYYKNVVLQFLRIKLKISVIFDNLIVNSIISKLNEPEFAKFSSSLEEYISLNTIDLTDPNKHGISQQKWIYVLKIAETLSNNKFISKSKFQQIYQMCTATNSTQDQLKQFERLTIQSINEGNGEKIKMSIWNKAVHIKCKDFWTKHIFQWPKLVSKSEIVKKVYQRFEKYLKQRLQADQIKKLHKLLGFHKEQQNETHSHDILFKMAELNCLFSYPNRVSKIEQQMSMVATTIKEQFEKANKQFQIANFETYGSYRSQISLATSDVDLTVYILDSNNIINLSRPFVQKSMNKLFSCIRTMSRKPQFKNKLQIDNVYSVINDKIKVPFIRIKFDNEMPLNQMDLVCNNINGIKNSKVLERYSKNKFIRNCALVLKKWAKQKYLIDTQKFSSYGLTLMLLYFFMRVKYIPFPTEAQLNDLSFQYRFKTKKDIAKVFQKFLQYYLEWKYSQHQQIVCLIKDCQEHKKINVDFVINIHDPFDGTNPGRLKQRDRYLFFDTVQSTLSQLYKANDLETSARDKALAVLFGFNYEDVVQSEIKQIIQID